MTKAEFDKLSNKEIANLSMDDAQYLMSKFMKGMFGQDESDIKMRKKGGVIRVHILFLTLETFELENTFILIVAVLCFHVCFFTTVL